MGPRCMGPAWHSGPHRRLFCRFSRFAAPFRAFSAAPEHLERPHGRVFRQPGRKTLQRGPLAAFSAAELPLVRVDGVIAFVRPSANRRFGGAYRCFGAADRRPGEREMPPLRERLVAP